MMICDADFDELFPHIFRPDQPAALPCEHPAPDAGRTARLAGDDDLALTPLRQPNLLTGLRLSANERLPDPLTDGMMAAMTPAAAIGDSLWAGLAAYVEMTRNLRSEQRAL